MRRCWKRCKRFDGCAHRLPRYQRKSLSRHLFFFFIFLDQLRKREIALKARLEEYEGDGGEPNEVNAHRFVELLVNLQTQPHRLICPFQTRTKLKERVITLRAELDKRDLSLREMIVSNLELKKGTTDMEMQITKLNAQLLSIKQKSESVSFLSYPLPWAHRPLSPDKRVATSRQRCRRVRASGS